MDKRVLTISNNQLSSGDCIVYVMSRDQRLHDNHALLCAQDLAIEQELPLVIIFNLLSGTGHRSREHYEFMLEGLKEIEKNSNKQGIDFVLITDGKLHQKIKSLNPSAVYFDFSPLRGPRKLQKSIAKQLDCACYVVDTHNIVPAWELSDKEEFGAYTIRYKVNKKLEDWLVDPPKLKKHPCAVNKFTANNWQEVEKIISKLPSNGIKLQFKPGEENAKKALDDFIQNRLPKYALLRNDPNIDFQSGLSPYLHFGQISSLRVAIEVSKDHIPLLFKEPQLAKYEGEPTLSDSIDAFLEELIVRKELADNFCFYSNSYDKLDGARQWAKDSLQSHLSDPREYIYELKELESAKTHDEAWNAAQLQLAKTGKMHGYMRMYWAKKILEWSKTPDEAITNTIYLNDHYSIDGGDPNGYVGIMWSIAGVHDRPWFDRPIFGKIRYMNYSGLKNRFNVEDYIKKWN